MITWNCTQHDQVYNLTGFGDVTRINSIDRDGNINARLSDGFGQSIGSLDADTNLSRNKYDETGQVRETIDANNVTMSYTYDDMGRQVATTTASGTTETIYDPATGRVDSRKDAKGNSTSYTYDILGRQTVMTDRLGEDTTRQYDSAGRLWKLTDAQNKSTYYTYDILSRKQTTTYPDNSVNSWSYDVPGYAAGTRANRMTYPSGKSKTTVASFDGTVDKIEYRNTAGAVTGSDDYTYDDQLRRSGSTSADGIVRSLTYNDNQQLETDTLSYGGQNYTVSYGYDDRLRQNSVTYPSGRVVDYTLSLIHISEPTRPY